MGGRSLESGRTNQSGLNKSMNIENAQKLFMERLPFGLILEYLIPMN